MYVVVGGSACKSFGPGSSPAVGFSKRNFVADKSSCGIAEKDIPGNAEIKPGSRYLIPGNTPVKGCIQAIASHHPARLFADEIKRFIARGIRRERVQLCPVDSSISCFPNIFPSRVGYRGTHKKNIS